MKITRGMVTEMNKTYMAWKNFRSMPFVGRVNFPSPISEAIACYILNLDWTGDGSRTGDAYDNSDRRIEIKATSINNDCTSFGPKEVFDKLVFVKVDTIEDKAFIYDTGFCYDDVRKIVVGKMTGQTFGDQCDAGRRPRFNVTNKIIKPNNIVPIAVYDFKEDKFSDE